MSKVEYKDYSPVLRLLWDITPLVALVGAVVGGVVYDCSEREKEKRYISNHLESNAPWVGFGNDITYKDTDSNGLNETWIRDPKTGEEHKIVIQR